MGDKKAIDVITHHAWFLWSTLLELLVWKTGLASGVQLGSMTAFLHIQTKEAKAKQGIRLACLLGNKKHPTNCYSNILPGTYLMEVTFIARIGLKIVIFLMWKSIILIFCKEICTPFRGCLVYAKTCNIPWKNCVCARARVTSFVLALLS